MRLAATQLDRLGGIIREAHAEVREYIMNLRTTPALHRPFFTAVQQYLEGFTSNYDIQTDLTVGSSLSRHNIFARYANADFSYRAGSAHECT